jgi:hypothetical protein
LKDLTWIGNPDSIDDPPLRFALDENVLGTDDVVEIVEYLVDQNPNYSPPTTEDAVFS